MLGHIAYFTPDDGKFYWVKASAFERNYEEGSVQVDANGNVVYKNGATRLAYIPEDICELL